MTPEGFEPPAFGFGIQRAAVAPWSLISNRLAVWDLCRNHSLVAPLQNMLGYLHRTLIPW